MRQYFGILLRFQRQHFEERRVVKAIAITIPTILVGNWLLHFEVSTLGLDPVWAYRTNWPVITFLCFVLNRAFTWGDRKNASILKWVLVSLLHSGVNQLLYPLLVHAGVHYILASVMLLGLGPFYFVFNNRHTFRKEKETDMA